MSAQTLGEQTPQDPDTSPRQEPFILLIGAPGSGKTKWANRYFHRTVITSLDQHRGQVTGTIGDQRATPYAVRMQQALVEGRLQFGRPVVVDNTNAVPKHRQLLLSPGYQHGRWPIAVIFDTPLDLCLEHNARRTPARRVDEHFLKDTHAAVREQFPVETTTIPAGFTAGAWVVYGDGMRVWGNYLESPRHHGGADWLDEARLPRPDGIPATTKYMRFRRSGWDRATASTTTD